MILPQEHALGPQCKYDPNPVGSDMDFSLDEEASPQRAWLGIDLWLFLGDKHGINMGYYLGYYGISMMILIYVIHT